MDCPKCGFVMSDLDAECPRCKRMGAAAPQAKQAQAAAPPPPPQAVPQQFGPAAPRPSAVDDAFTTIIPVRNGYALGAYYLGLFSLFPLLGTPMAIVAIVLGVKALKFATANPGVKGKGHAWVGIICGALFGLISTGISALIIGAIASS